jgi:light-regulated signal transduction histidine kinase (bacteriophytochrome)
MTTCSETLSARAEEYVQVFRRAGDNLLNLINDILDLSKVESGQMELEQSRFRPLRGPRKGRRDRRRPRPRQGLELSCRIMPDVPLALVGDAGRLRQIILNLLGNSVKFTERGELSVVVEPDPERREPGGVRVSVRDTGIGIAPDKLTAVFESFTQADTSITRKYGGTGLGLSISKKFAELMGGRMWVESILGSGSTFYFTAAFPVKVPQPAPPPDFVGLRCLVVDDNASHRVAVSGILASWDALVEESGRAGARAAFQAGIESGDPHSLVLLDARASCEECRPAGRAHLRSRGIRPPRSC